MSTTATADAFSLADLREPRPLGALYRNAAIVVLSEETLDAILAFSEQDLRRERGGFLLGNVYGAGPAFVVVRKFHPALEAQSAASSLTFTHEAWAALHREAERSAPGTSIVGWQHTHPGFGVFLSGYDLFIHRHFFPQPWQIALVVDPQRRELGFFHWRRGEVRDCGFVCAADV